MRRTTALFAVLAVVMLVSACAPTTAFHRPTPPIPDNWPLAISPLAAGDAAKTHWRAFFIDPKLQVLITAALEHNRDLRIAAGRVEEARALYGIARADQTPTVNLLGASNGSGSRIPGASSQRYDLSLSSVSYELDFWGRVANLSQAARNSYLATAEAQRAVHLSLVADVASAYFNLLQLEELGALARSTLALREQSLVLIAKGRDIGGAYDYEYQQASGLLESARANLASLEHQRAVTTNQLNFLVGNAPSALPAALPLGLSLDAQGFDVDLAPGLPSEVLLLRPDVMAAEQRLAAAHANIAAARAAFLPKIVLTAGLGVASQGLASLFSGGAWLFQPSMTLPIFDGGRLASGVDVAKAREVIAVAEYEKTIQQAFREVSDQLSARASWASQLKAAQINKNAQAQRLKIAEARYNGGLISYLDVLEGQRELVTAQQAFAQIRRSQLDAAALLYKALGGGSQSLSHSVATADNTPNGAHNVQRAPLS